MPKDYVRRRKMMKSKERVTRDLHEKIGKMEFVGEGAYFEVVKDETGNVRKYLKPEKYFYNKRVDANPWGEKKSYLHRLKILLEVEKSDPNSRVAKIEREFEKKFGRKPDYEFMVSKNTGIAVVPKGEWSDEEIKFFNDKLWEITKSELKFIDKLNTKLWNKVKESKVNVVERRSSDFDPELGIIERYEYGGKTFHKYWLERWDDAKKAKLFKELKNHVSEIVKQTLRAYEKYGVGVDAHPSNWVIDYKSRIKYVDFEPNSVVTDPELSGNRVIAALAALYMDVGTIVRDKGLLHKIREVMINHAKQHVSTSFARELEQKISKSEAWLKKAGYIK